MKGDSPRAIFLSDYQSPAYLISTVELEFDLYDEHTIVNSKISFTKQRDEDLVLNGQQLELIKIQQDGRALQSDEYQIDDDSLTLTQLPQQFDLQITTKIKPEQNLSLEGLYRSSGTFCTQCEAEGFRKITYYMDRPDVMAVYTVTIKADRDSCPVMLSNGNLVEEGQLENNRHWVKWHDPFKKPSYLFALVAGKLEYIEDNYLAKDERNITLRIYVEPENINYCDHAMQSLKKAMQWDEDKFGLIYDLDIYMIVAVSYFNMGAMENKGLNVFNSKYVLASPETATDSDYDGIESVIAHEYFHNWTGNRVTCRDWFQLSLKEGLTVYRDQEFSCDMTARAVKRIQDVRILRTHQFAEDAGPMAHPVRPLSYEEINNFYTVTVYNKGAEVVRMYQSLFGTEGFRKGMDLYFSRHDGQAVTTDDFFAAMADANEAEIKPFKYWYSQAGTPELTVSDQYSESEQQYTLTIRQKTPATPDQPTKEPFYIPIVTALLSREGEQLTVQHDDSISINSDGNFVLIMDQQEQSFVFNAVKSRPLPSLLRGFSAPVKLTYPYSDSDLALLISHDEDDFNRWEASQNLVLRILTALIANEKVDASLSVLVESLSTLLESASVDKGLLAEILTLPSESYIAELQHGVIDVDAIHNAVETLRSSLSDRLQDKLVSSYRDNQANGDYQFETGAVARRRLKNTLLQYLVQSQDENAAELCEQQYRQANNMTDVMAALACAVDLDGEIRATLLQDFYERWKHDTLVLDKWFALQGFSKAGDTLERVQALMKHEAFSINNPNKVRALIGSFAANLTHFHRQDGAGYAFLADNILTLDATNPQIAARLMKPFTRWKRYDETRKALMRAELERILAHPNLSPDCNEIASKSLA